MSLLWVGRFRYIQPVWIACHWLAMSNCCYNPIVYCWMNDRFRTGFQYAFRCCPCVRRPDIPPAVMAGERIGGCSTMYGGMSVPTAAVMRSAAAGDRAGRRTPVVLYRVGEGSPRIAIPTSSSDGRSMSGAELSRSRLTICSNHSRQGQQDQVEAVVENYQLKPTNRID